MKDNEVMLVRQSRPADPPYDPALKARAWARLQSEFTADDPTRHRNRRTRSHAMARRNGMITLAAGSAALLAGAAAAIVAVNGAGRSDRAAGPTLQPVALSSDTTLRTDLGSTFPRHLVAAGHTAVAAYYTGHVRVSADKSKSFDRTWFLYDPESGTYEGTPWAFLDVAPGMHQAAVLEGPLPASRVGVLDMNTRKVIRWITVDHRIGGVSWAPDGHRLVLTAYTGNPDTQVDDVPCLVSGKPSAADRARLGDKIKPCPPPSSRVGYYIANAETGQNSGFHALPKDNFNPGSRQDLGWSRNGTLIWAPTATSPTKKFFDLDGNPRPTPAHEADSSEDAGLSPNGTLLPTFGPKPGPAVTVTNVTTGKAVAVLPIEQARAWADDTQLFAVGCAAEQCKGQGEFRNRLLLVTLKGKITPLTGYHRSDRAGSWVPLFTHR